LNAEYGFLILDSLESVQLIDSVNKVLDS